MTSPRTLTRAQRVDYYANEPEGNQVKRLCVGCFRLHPPADIARNLMHSHCVCNDCKASQSPTDELEEAKSVGGTDTDTKHRYAGAL